MRASLILRVLAAIALVTLAAIGYAYLPLKQYLIGFLEWTQQLGGWGPVLLGAAYVPAAVLFVPGSLLTLGAGFAFGVLKGTIAVSLGSVAGTTAAFLSGRWLVRGWVEERATRNPRFRAIDQAVAEQGFKIVLLTRLSPVLPFTLLNYAFGLTRVRLRDYVVASWIGMLPGTLMYVYFGSAIKDLANLTTGQIDGGPAQRVLFFLGLAATVGLTVWITRLARTAFDQATRTDNAPLHAESGDIYREPNDPGTEGIGHE